LRVRVHPLLSFTSPAEFVSFQICPALAPGAPPLEFLLPIATSTRRVHLRTSFPGLALRSAPGVSHALDGLLLLQPRGFVSPRSHVRDSPLRGCSPLPSRIASSATVTLLSLPAFSCRRVASMAPDPSASPPGSCSVQRSEIGDRVFSPSDALDPLPGFQLPRAPLRVPRRSPSRSPPLVTSTAVVCV